MSAYDVLREKHQALVASKIADHIDRLQWDRDRIRAEQEAGLRRVLRQALQSSPWHRDRIGPVDPDSFTLEDLASIPPMSKDDLMDNWDDIVTDRRLSLDRANDHLDVVPGTTPGYLFDEYHVMKTGGSSGNEAVVTWDWDGWATMIAASNRVGWYDFMNSPDLQGVAPVMASLSVPHQDYHMRPQVDAMMGVVDWSSNHFSLLVPLPELVARLNEAQPTHLWGIGSSVRLLAEEALQGRLHINPLRVFTAGETTTPRMREVIEATWGCRVNNVWSCTEAAQLGAPRPWLSYEGAHLNEDVAIIEPVDKDGNAVPVGQQSDKVLVTNLMSRVQPLIRYELSDRVTILDQACPAGSGYRLIGDVDSRRDYELVYDNGSVVPSSFFDDALESIDEVIEYQVRQIPRGAEILIRSREGAGLEDRIKGEIELGLAAAGLEAPEVTFKPVDFVARPDGKFDRFVLLDPSRN